MSAHFFHKSTDEIYTPIREAMIELSRRRNDPILQEKIKEFFGKNSFHPLADNPKAVLSRPVATPNFELSNFILQAEMVGLDPLIVEYPGKLTAKNKDKYHLCMMYTRNGRSKNGIHIVKKTKIVDISVHEGDEIKDTKTISHGASLIDFHHKLLNHEYPHLMDSVVDFTEWFSSTRNTPDSYYLYYLSLFITNGILFENFFFNDAEEDKFIYEKLMPSFKKVEELFGCKPLIVPLLPLENERSHSWLYYPESIEKTARDLIGV